MPHKSSNLHPESSGQLVAIKCPKSATLSFIRQFARTCADVDGCAFGAMILN